jgi:hypothetical protein
MQFLNTYHHDQAHTAARRSITTTQAPAQQHNELKWDINKKPSAAAELSTTQLI